MPSEILPNSQTKNPRRRAVVRVAEHIRIAVSRSGNDTRRMIQELERSLIELELQLEELRQNKVELELNYDELYDSAPVGYFTLGRYGEIENSNLTGAGMLGQPRAWLLHQQFSDFLTPESLPAFNTFFRRVMEACDKASCVVTLLKGGNTPVSAYIEATGAGAQASCRAMVVDINAAEQARLALREREAQLKLAQVASDMGVWELEYGSGDMCWSPNCFDILGVDRSIPTLDALARLLHPEDSPRVRSIVSEALAAGKEHSVECRMVRPNGEVIWIFVRGHVHLDKNGEPLRLFGIVQNITRRKQAERNNRDEATNKARCGANFIVPSATNLRS